MTKPPTPFTHVAELYKRRSSYRGDDGYAQYIINKELSKNGPLIELVNYIQAYPLPNDIHFRLLNEFYGGSRRPGFKAFPWIWKKSTKKIQDEVDVIAQYYDESKDHALEYHEILSKSKEGKEHIKWLLSIHGRDNK